MILDSSSKLCNSLIMAKGQRPAGSDKSAIITAVPKACADELAAVEFIESLRWSETGPCCQRCGDTDVYKMTDRKTGQRNKRFLWKCNGCQKQYTVRVGTVMEDSRIPLRHWAYALWKACSSKKGVSALQIKRETGLTYKSALFMMHRIRFGMAEDWRGQPKLERHSRSRRNLRRRKTAQQADAARPAKGLASDSQDAGSVARRTRRQHSLVRNRRRDSGQSGPDSAGEHHADTHLMTDSSPIHRSHVIQSPFARTRHDRSSEGRVREARTARIATRSNPRSRCSSAASTARSTTSAASICIATLPSLISAGMRAK